MIWPIVKKCTTYTTMTKKFHYIHQIPEQIISQIGINFSYYVSHSALLVDKQLCLSVDCLCFSSIYFVIWGKKFHQRIRCHIDHYQATSAKFIVPLGKWPQNDAQRRFDLLATYSCCSRNKTFVVIKAPKRKWPKGLLMMKPQHLNHPCNWAMNSTTA